jgi:hypothetical protein
LIPSQFLFQKAERSLDLRWGALAPNGFDPRWKGEQLIGLIIQEKYNIWGFGFHL